MQIRLFIYLPVHLLIYLLLLLFIYLLLLLLPTLDKGMVQQHGTETLQCDRQPLTKKLHLPGHRRGWTDSALHNSGYQRKIVPQEQIDARWSDRRGQCRGAADCNIDIVLRNKRRLSRINKKSCCRDMWAASGSWLVVVQMHQSSME